MKASLVLLPLLGCTSGVYANPYSKPYVPFRTSPWEQPNNHHELEWSEKSNQPKLKFQRYNKETAKVNDQCPLQFSLGVSKRSHGHEQHANGAAMSISQPPIIYPIHPSRGPGRQVLYTTQYEHLDLLSPATAAQLGLITSSVIKEGLVQQEDFPLLFESSSFYASPILHDVDGDGVLDAILVDYDGGIYVVGLAASSSSSDQSNHKKRYFHRAQVPRIYLRRDWMEARLNETLPKEEEEKNETEQEESRKRYYQEKDPYYSYFDYNQRGASQEKVLQGVTANILEQDKDDLKGLEERRQRQVDPLKKDKPEEPESANSDNEEHKEEVPPDNKSEKKVDERKIANKNNEKQKEKAPPVNKSENEEQKKEVPPDNKSEKKVDERKIANKNNEKQKKEAPPGNEGKKKEDEAGGGDKAEEAAQHRRLQEEHEGGEQGEPDPVQEHREEEQANAEDQGRSDETRPEDHHGDEHYGLGDDMDPEERVRGGEGMGDMRDDDAPMDDEYPGYHGDDEYRGRYGYDDYNAGRYGGGDYDSDHDFYNEKHFIRIPPHVLCDPLLVEMPKMYGNTDNELDDILIMAVSYYLDEDEYEGLFSYKRFEETDHGDETEVQRGMYVTNALMFYQLGSGARWGRQEQLDLSGDCTAPQNTSLVAAVPVQVDESKMGAFALGTPTVADFDGDGSLDLFVGTSMGIVYAFDAQHLYNREGWPVQMKHAVENRILLEDVMGDTNLEVFVSDVGGNVVCLDTKGRPMWDRDLLRGIVEPGQILGLSPMTLGDVDGDGVLDLVMVIRAEASQTEERFFVFAISATSGRDLANFPIAIETKVTERHFFAQKIPQPLLVDLHADQGHWKSYLHRNATKWAKEKNVRPPIGPPHGGSAQGLHIVQPVGSDLYIIEAGSGCIQTVAIGDEVTAMIQADDVHGTNNLDLVVSTKSGNVVTLESPAVPFHPLNVWNSGEVRGGGNSFAHGLSASQGIFVHDVSRQYRDVFGIYVPVTFEIFDNRPNIQNEEGKRSYAVEVRAGTSSKRAVMRKNYNAVGVYTERVYIPYGPGYYTLVVRLMTSHGLIYEDTFHVGYNVHFMDGFGLLLWLPLVIAAVPILLCGRKKLSWDDEDYEADERGGRGMGILDHALPSFSS